MQGDIHFEATKNKPKKISPRLKVFTVLFQLDCITAIRRGIKGF